MKVTKSMKERVNHYGDTVVFIFCKKCDNYVSIKDSAIGDEVLCNICGKDKNITIWILGHGYKNHELNKVTDNPYS